MLITKYNDLFLHKKMEKCRLFYQKSHFKNIILIKTVNK